MSPALHTIDGVFAAYWAEAFKLMAIDGGVELVERDIRARSSLRGFAPGLEAS